MKSLASIAAMIKREEPVKEKRPEIAEPTPEQMRHGSYAVQDVVDKLPGGKQISLGKAYRKHRMLEKLARQGLFSEAEAKALRHYQHHADTAERSPVRDSLNKQRGGSGTGPTVEYLNACRVRDDCERAAGQLADILRAVIIDDLSLSDWAIQRFGGVDKFYVRKGPKNTTIKVHEIRAKEEALKQAKVDIRMAAHRVESELKAW